MEIVFQLFVYGAFLVGAVIGFLFGERTKKTPQGQTVHLHQAGHAEREPAIGFGMPGMSNGPEDE